MIRFLIRSEYVMEKYVIFTAGSGLFLLVYRLRSVVFKLLNLTFIDTHAHLFNAQDVFVLTFSNVRNDPFRLLQLLASPKPMW